jgi:hypothetical protein
MNGGVVDVPHATQDATKMCSQYESVNVMWIYAWAV